MARIMPTNPGGDAPTRRRLSQLTGMDTTEAANPVRSRGAPDQCFSDVVPQRRRTQPSGLLPQSPTPGFSTALGLARTATSLYSRWPVRPAQPFPGPIRRAAPVDPHARPCACRTRRWDRPGPTPKHWVRRPCTPPTSVSNPPGTAQKVGDINRGDHTLYRAAKADPGRRFHVLHDKVLMQGRHVACVGGVGMRRNDGAGSIDRIAPDAVEGYGVTRILDALVTDLREDRWHPMPVPAGIHTQVRQRGTARPLSIRGA
jgi:hypothetical protein